MIKLLRFSMSDFKYIIYSKNKILFKFEELPNDIMQYLVTAIEINKCAHF